MVQRNIVMICTDDEDAFTDETYMPLLKSLVTDLGCKFTACYDEYAVCGPSRASMLTGLASHNTGITENDPPGGYEAYQALEGNALPVWLQAAGYDVWHVGKFMNHFADGDNGPTHIPPGYDEWFVGPMEPEFVYTDYDINDNGTIVSYSGSSSANYLTHVLTDKAVELIEGATSAPFCLFLWPLSPHNPSDPAPEDLGDFSAFTMPQSLNYNEVDVSDKPGYIQSRGNVNTNKAQARWRERRECQKSVDRMVQAVVNALTAAGKLANTVIIYMSDNGYAQGAHRLSGKETAYEEGCKVPLIIKGPGVDAGVTCSKLIWNIDITPTILALAEATAGRTQDGRSLVPLFTDQDATWRTALKIACQPEVGISVNAVRTDDWMYAEWESATYGSESELYGMETDPFQLTNRANSGEYLSVQTDLATALDTLRTCSGNSCWITTTFEQRNSQTVWLRTGNPTGWHLIELIAP